MSLEDLKLTFTRAKAGANHGVIWDDITLERGRVHEICGPARHSFAAFCVGRIVRDEGAPIFWISPQWQAEQLHFAGACAWLPPHTIVHVTPRHSRDLWWCAEEILRSGVSPVLVIEAQDMPHLTQVRRLHLAAEHGDTHGPHAPIGLIVSTHHGGISGIESRYACTAHHRRDDPCWRIERRRARTAPPKAWDLRPNGASRWRLAAVPMSEDAQIS